MRLERLRGSVVVNAERSNEVVAERSLPIFQAVTGDGTAYFNKVPRNLSRVYL